MKKKLILVLPVLLLVVAGGAYKFVLAPKPVEPEKKIEGMLVPLEKEFVVNLADGRFAKVVVAVLVEAAEGGAGHGEEGGLVQEAAVRAVITDELTGLDSAYLVEREKRHKTLAGITKAIKSSTDEHVEEVFFTDITVQ